MKKIILTMIMTVLSFGTFARSFNLTGIDKKPIITYKTKNNLEVSVAGRYIPDDDLVRYVVNIKNNGTEDFYFDEDSMSVLQGNYENDNWTYINYYTASKYYTRKDAEWKAAAVAAGLGIGLAVMDAVIDSTIPKSRPNKYGRYNPPLSRRHYRPFVSFVDPLLDIGLSALVISSLMDDYNYSPSHLKEALLFSKKIAPGESLSGYFMAERSFSPDYLVRFALSQDEVYEFVFTRDDREEILHPWSDPISGRSSISYGLFFPMSGFNFSFNYIYGGQPLGFYLMADFQIDAGKTSTIGKLYNDSYVEYSQNPYITNSSTTLSFETTGKLAYDIGGFTAGFTFKAIPHTWFLIGCGADFETVYQQGNIIDETTDTIIATNQWVYNEKENIYFVPQIGFNTVFYFLNFGGTLSWRLGTGQNHGPKFGAFVGVTF